MENDIEQKTSSVSKTPTPILAIELIFKHPDIGQKLNDEEKQLLHSCIGEILGEIEVEEKRIIQEERKAALEVTAHNKKEG